MKRSRWFRIAVVSGWFAIVFLATPIILGYHGIGARDGPVFYPKGLHTSLYILGHEAATGEEPREALTWLLYERPLFWGLPRRPKSADDRNKLLKKIADKAQGTDSTLYQALFAENERINKG